MTVKEFIKILSRSKPEAEVVTEWEGIMHKIDKGDVLLGTKVVISANATLFEELSGPRRGGRR